jgi:class 3 adenylate cyclase/tetratricopeptide (TPR) repeat protein
VVQNAHVRRVPVTVLKADISGSTPLAERLDPEELRGVLGAYFAALAREIQRHGGTVDKYIGDAVMAVFGLPLPHPDDAARATRAALAMLEAIARENESLQARYAVQLSLRIGVNSGELIVPDEGDPTLIGSAVVVAESMESAAPLNAVLVSESTRLAAARRFRFTPAGQVTIKGRGDRVAAYRVDAARTRAAGPGGSSPAGGTGASLQVGGQQPYRLEEERKVVTVLFADVAVAAGQLGPDDVRPVLNVYFSDVAREIQRFGGTIDKFIGDAVMAVFGAPVSHEDDAARAIHAALAIQLAIRKENARLEREYNLRLTVRIGVHTGEVVAGLLPGEVLAYTVTGDAVNTAQRIQSVTPADEVLASEETYALARKTFEFEPVAPLTLKGKARPMPAFRVIRPLEAGAIAGPPLVGRGAELARLRALFVDAEAGRGAVAHLHGEAGVGKSRILAELLTTLAMEVRHISARCSSYESATPYALIADLLRHWAGLQLSADEVTTRAAIDELLAPLALSSAESATALLLELLGYGERSELDPESKGRQLLVLVHLLFGHRAASGVFVLTLEDLHWIDPASSSLLGAVLASVQQLRCLVITTSREASAGSWDAVAVPVGPLDESGANEMVERMTPVPLDAKVRALIVERTGGNPFFIEEVVRAIGSGRTITVPATVQELLEARLDALDAGPKHVAQRAAVIGRTFWTRVLTRVAEGESVPPALATLEQERFVAPYETTPEETYSFRHALVQEVVYATQLIAQRRRTHRAVGSAIAELFVERLDEYTDILAYHFGRSDDDAQARRFLLLAGQRAQRLYANDEALAYYEGALARSAADEATRAVAYEGIGAVRRFQGRLGDAITSFEQAAEALGEGDSLGRARVQAKIAAILRLRGRREDALALLEATLAVLPEDADRERTLVLLELAETHWHQGAFNAAIAALEAAIVHAERAEASESLATAYKHLGTVHTLRGELPEGLRWYERSLELFVALDDPSAQSKVLNNIGSAHQRQARYPEALDALGRSLEIKRRLGDPLGIGAAQNNLGQVYRLLGDLDRAQAEYSGSLEQFEIVGVATGIALAHSGLGSTALDRGDRATAREHFLIELAESERLGQRASLFEPQRNIALTYVAEDLDLALQWAERALASARAAGVAEQEALALQVLGIVWTARGKPAEAITALEAGRALLPAGDRHELARTIVALARAYRALPANDPRRTQSAPLLSQARATFAELGAALDLQRLEESDTTV